MADEALWGAGVTRYLTVHGRGGERLRAMIDVADERLVRGLRWGVDDDGYVVSSNRERVRLHRLILGLERGDGLEGDHRNGDPLDNRRSNLRVATRLQNGQNVAAKGGASRYRGVTRDTSRRTRKCWRARIWGKQGAHIGWFLTEAEARAAVDAWLLQHMPFAEAERSVA